MGWDNTPPRGPIQPHLAQWGQAPRCPISATTLSLKISATLSCSLAGKWSANLRGGRKTLGKRREPSYSMSSGLENVSAGLAPCQVDCFHSPVPAPLPLHPNPGGLPHSGLPQASPQWLSGIHATLLIVPRAATKYVTGALTPTQASQHPNTLSKCLHT